MAVIWVSVIHVGLLTAEPSDVNAHPHLSQSASFAVVHNGIIENYISLKKKLESKGFELFLKQIQKLSHTFLNITTKVT